MNCLHCEENGKEAPGTMDDYGINGPYCDDCWSNQAEIAHERMLNDYYGGSSPVTLQEQYYAAVQQRRDLRSKD